jgi:hypothetical protein
MLENRVSLWVSLRLVVHFAFWWMHCSNLLYAKIRTSHEKRLSNEIGLSLLGMWDASKHYRNTQMLTDCRSGHRDSPKPDLSLDTTLSYLEISICKEKE